MRNLTILIEPQARDKILAFAEAVTTEIGGLLAVRQEGRTLTIADAWTVPQEVSAGGVDFEVGHFEDHIKAMGWLNGKPMPHICMGTWHSHGNGPVFWSNVDEKDLSRKYAMRGFLVNIVVNSKGDWFCQVDSMVGPENGKPEDYVLVVVPSTLKLINLREPALLAQVNAEIKANVRERKWIIPAKGDDDFAGWGWEGHFPGPQEPNFNDNRHLFAKARGRDRDGLLGGVWSINKKAKRMEKWSNGKLVATIAKMGDGEMTLYDEDGKVLCTDKSPFRLRKGYPPAVL